MKQVCKEPKHWTTVDPSYEGDNEQNALDCSDLRHEASNGSGSELRIVLATTAVSGSGRPCARKPEWFRQHTQTLVSSPGVFD